MNPGAASIADLVQRLSSPDAAVRAKAGRELHVRGRDLVEQAISLWRRDPEASRLITQHATVGVAVTPEHFAAIRSALGNPRLAAVPPDQDAEEFEWSLAPNVHLDILTTREPCGGGAIARFLARFGEGIQQVEFLTPDINRATRILASRLGVAPVYPATCAGADSTRVNFFLASTPDGKKVLVELVESPQEITP